MWQSYKGGAEYARGGHLFRFRLEKEQAGDFEARQKRAFYVNFCRPVIDTYTDFLFREPVSLALSYPWLGEITSDVTLTGVPLASWRRLVHAHAAVYGHTHILVDSPREEEMAQVQNEAEREERRVRPFARLIDPPNLIDWARDRFGRFLWAKVRELEDEPADWREPKRRDLILGAQYRYRIWTPSDWFLLDASGQQLATGPNRTGIVPLVPVYGQDVDMDFRGESLIADIWRINRAIYNWTSLLDEILYEQTFSQLVIEDVEDEDLKEVGVKRALTYPRSGNPPQFISPDPRQAQLFFDGIDRAVQWIYRLASLSRSSPDQVKQPQSGIAKAYDFEETGSRVAGRATAMQTAELGMFSLFARWYGGDPPSSAAVAYPTKFDLRSLEQELATALELQAQRLGTQFEKWLRAKIIRKAAGSATDAEIKDMISAMEAESL